MKLGDAAAAAVLLVLAVGLFLARGLQTGQQVLIVTVQGESASYELNEDQTLEIKPGVVIEIKDGQARFVQSPCRDQLCVNAGWLERAGDTACCLPERTAIERRGTGAEADGIAG